MEKIEIEMELVLQALSVALSELSKQTVFRGQLKAALQAKKNELSGAQLPLSQLDIADKLISRLRG